MRVLSTLLLGCLSGPLAASPQTPSFADFDRRAAAGERLTVCFFGGSLT